MALRIRSHLTCDFVHVNIPTHFECGVASPPGRIWFEFWRNRPYEISEYSWTWFTQPFDNTSFQNNLPLGFHFAGLHGNALAVGVPDWALTLATAGLPMIWLLRTFKSLPVHG